MGIFKKSEYYDISSKQYLVKQMNGKRNIFFMVLHCTLLIIFIFLEFSKIGHENDRYKISFGIYISYSLFNIFWKTYGLVGNFLFGVLRKKVTIWQFILFEAIWIILIYINWKMYTSSH